MKRVRRCALLVGAVVTAGVGLGAPVHATGDGPPGGVVAEGLTDPFGLTNSGRHLVVTEAGAGQVRTIDTRTGRVATVVEGLGPYAAASAVKIGDRYVIVTGEDDAGAVPASSVLVAKAGGTPRQRADLLAHELENNPDGQTQFGPEGEPLDALSNPFAVMRDRSHKGFVLVADGGANDVLRVTRDGDVTTFFVPPTVNTGACEGLPNNDENTVGCDAVPTGLAYSPDKKKIYVSALTAEVPGEGRVYVVDARTGKLHHVIKGFSAPTGVEVKRSGAVFVSELLEGVPAGEPGPDFDPSTVGRIVKVRPDGARSASQVTMPVGLVAVRGQLYSTAWSVAGLFLGATGLGQVVEVADGSFESISSGDDARRVRPSGLGDTMRLGALR
jgi:DNA-binding beta-propeller fold protein YncE